MRVHQDRVEGVANRGAPHLRVGGHGDGRLHLGGGVHVGVAHADAACDGRHLGVLRHKVHQRGTASRHNQVNVLAHTKHLQHQRAVRVFDELHGLNGAARRLDGVADDSGEHGVGVHGLLAAAQDARIAGLEAEGGDVDGHVGTAPRR